METLSEKLRNLETDGAYPFHMPGHKRQLDGAYRYDITEIEGFDNLNSPRGIIAEMNKSIADHYYSEVSFFTVNGSTCGNLSAISAVADMGDTILIARNCHKSVINAVILRKLNVEYINPKMYNDSLIGFVSVSSVMQAVTSLESRGTKPKAVVITSPTYEGVVSDVKGISEFLHSKDIPLIVDSAHGAHFHFDSAFPEDSLRDIDICIMSAHKTLPVLNQGAIIHVNSDLVDPENVMRYISMYQTSSPSYVIIESMSRALELIDEKNPFPEYVANLRRFYEKTADLRALSVEPISSDRDMGKIVIYTNNYLTGDELGRTLREDYRFELEMYGRDYVLAMTSCMDTAEALDGLAEALVTIDKGIDISAKCDAKPGQIIDTSTKGDADLRQRIDYLRHHEKRMEPFEAVKNTVSMPVEETIGKIAGEVVTAYPPGIPVIIPGEIIDESDVDYMKETPCYTVLWAKAQQEKTQFSKSYSATRNWA